MIDGEPGTLEEADAALTAGMPEPEEVSEPAAEPAAEPGQPRDEQGRFTEAPTAEPEASQEEPAAPEPPGEPTESVEGEPPDAEEGPYESFSYRADGQEIEIPGSEVGDEGIFIPADQIPDVQNLLSAGKAFFGSARQRFSEAAAREQQAVQRAEAAEAQSSHVLAHFENLIEKSQHANTIEELLQTPLGQWFMSVKQGWPILKAEAASKALEMKGQQAQQELQRYRQQEQDARLKPLMEQTLRQEIWSRGQQLGLDERTMQAVHQRLQRFDQAYLYPKAPEDYPADGIRKGDTVINRTVIQEALELAALNRPAVQQQQQQQDKIKQAKAANAKLQPTPSRIPPTVGGKGKAPTAGGVPVFKSAKEADEALLHGDLSWAEQD
jgi:hypothetical protein